ncbi:MAG: oligosaccharide flippase family protein [Bacteroidota bacterium]
MSILKQLAGQTALYGLSSVLGRMLNYLLVPFYTAVFVPEEYGIITELYAYVAFLNILYIYGLETAYFRFSGKEDNDQYFHLAFTSILFSSIVLSGIIWIFSPSLADLLQYPGKQNYIKWLALILAIDAIVAIPFAKLRKEGKAGRFAAYKLSNIIFNILLNLFFILFCPWFLDKKPDHFLSSIYHFEFEVGYVFLSNLIANALFLIFFIPLWKKVKIHLSGTVWKRMMNYAWPVFIIGLAGVTNEMLSRAMLKHRLPEDFYTNYSNLEMLGIFGACYKLSVFMTLAVQAFRYAFEPFFFAQAKKKNAPKVFSQIMTSFVLFTSFSWLALSLFVEQYSPFFLRQESYLEALDAVPWLLGGGLFLGVFYNLSIWYKLTDRTLYGAYISIVGALMTLALNWLLIPIYGYMGSAYATFLSYFCMVILSYLWGKKYYPVPYRLPKILLYVFLAGLGIALNEYLNATLFSAILITLIFLTLAFLFESRNPSRSKI